MQGVRIGDPSKMAAAQYVSSNRQRQSIRRLRMYMPLPYWPLPVLYAILLRSARM